MYLCWTDKLVAIRVLLVLCVSGCSFQGPSLEVRSPFGMSEKEVDKRVAELVNPALKSQKQGMSKLAQAIDDLRKANQ